MTQSRTLNRHRRMLAIVSGQNRGVRTKRKSQRYRIPRPESVKELQKALAKMYPVNHPPKDNPERRVIETFYPHLTIA